MLRTLLFVSDVRRNDVVMWFVRIGIVRQLGESFIEVFVGLFDRQIGVYSLLLSVRRQ